MKSRRIRIAKTISEKKNKVGRIRRYWKKVLNFKTYYIAIVIKIVWYCQEGHIHIVLEQNRVTRNRPIQIWPTDFWQNCLIWRRKGSIFIERWWGNWTLVRKSEPQLLMFPILKLTEMDYELKYKVNW